MTNWYRVTGETEEEAAEQQTRLSLAWPDAPLANLEVCELLLETAREQVIEFAPAPSSTPVAEVDEDGYVVVIPAEETPKRYALAQLEQAKNMWNYGRVSSDGSIGDGGYVFTPRPLDRNIKRIIRPMSGKPHVL